MKLKGLQSKFEKQCVVYMLNLRLMKNINLIDFSGSPGKILIPSMDA